MTRTLVSLLAAVALTFGSLASVAAQPKPIPAGFEENCHTQTFKSTLHCHVVPEGAQPTWIPGDAGTIGLQIVGGLLGLVVLGGGAGFATYAATGGNFTGECPAV